MLNAKSNINVKIDDEQIIVAVKKRNPKKVELTADAKGNIKIDKEKNPEIYDWAING